MPYCSHCGTKISDEAFFCPNCGTKTQKGEKENVKYPADELRAAFNEAGVEIEKAFHIAAREMQKAFQDIKEDYQSRSSNQQQTNQQNVASSVTCTSCGSTNNSDAVFCRNCGNKIAN